MWPVMGVLVAWFGCETREQTMGNYQSLVLHYSILF